MKLYELASGRSVGRGIAYFQNHRVTSWTHIGDNKYSGSVSGSGEVSYDVVIDEKHPKRSTCTCPHGENHNVICKHMVALYFTVHPEEYVDLLKEMEDVQAEIQSKMHERYQELKQYVLGLSKQDLQDQLFRRLLEEDKEYQSYLRYEDPYYTI